jgi:glucosamine--fructose-6-phosphate aminotransferase (isomerizing)
MAFRRGQGFESPLLHHEAIEEAVRCKSDGFFDPCTSNWRVIVAATALYETIINQPEIVGRVLDATRQACDEAGEALASRGRVFVAGTGSSSHAAVVGEHLLRTAGIEAFATTSFDFAVYPRPLRATDALIVISHTGGTQYGAQAIERAAGAGALVIGITRVSSKMTGDHIRIPTGPNERSDTYTASYIASLGVLGAVAVAAGRKSGTDIAALSDAVGALPATLGHVIVERCAVDPVAEAAAARGRVILIGAGPNAVTSREGALKIKESSYITAEGFELETALHGALQAVEPGDLAVLIAADGPAVGRMKDTLRVLSAIGARTWVVADERVANAFGAQGDGAGAEWLLSYPTVPEVISPAVATVPLQLLAARIAELRGTNPDNFRFDTPAFKAAYTSITL